MLSLQQKQAKRHQREGDMLIGLCVKPLFPVCSVIFASLWFQPAQLAKISLGIEQCLIPFNAMR